MRGLELRDVIIATRMITEMDIKEDLKNIVVAAYAFNAQEHEEDEKEAFRLRFGIDLWWILLSGASKKRIESDLFSFIGSLIAAEPEDVSKMKVQDLVLSFKEKVDMKEFVTFFKNAVQSMMQN